MCECGGVYMCVGGGGCEACRESVVSVSVDMLMSGFFSQQVKNKNNLELKNGAVRFDQFQNTMATVLCHLCKQDQFWSAAVVCRQQKSRVKLFQDNFKSAELAVSDYDRLR